MAYVLDIEIRFYFEAFESDGSKVEVTESFNAADSSLQAIVDQRAQELLDEIGEGISDEYIFTDYTIEWYDTDWAAPDYFSDLNEYGAYAEKVEKHGEAYHLRYMDIDDNDFEDEYCGEWESAEDYVRNNYDDIPEHLERYIDWEVLTSDVMMDYSEYEDSQGMVHIFRN